MSVDVYLWVLMGIDEYSNSQRHSDSFCNCKHKDKLLTSKMDQQNRILPCKQQCFKE